MDDTRVFALVESGNIFLMIGSFRKVLLVYFIFHSSLHDIPLFPWTSFPFHLCFHLEVEEVGATFINADTQNDGEMKIRKKRKRKEDISRKGRCLRA